jgi:hypothetical protein
MRNIVKRPYTRKMDLLPLSVGTPLFTSLLEAPLEVCWGDTVHLTHSYALPLRTVDLLPHSLILIRDVNLCGIESLLGDGTERASPEFLSEVRLGLLVNTEPYWLERESLELLEVRPDDAPDLVFLAERAPKGDREPVLRNVPYGRASFIMSPYSPGRVEPGSVRCIPVLCDELRNKNAAISLIAEVRTG